MNTDNNLTPKEYLSRAFHLDILINGKLAQLDDLRAIATKVTAHMSDMPKSATPNKHSMEDTIIKLVDLEREVTADIDALVDIKCDIRAVIKAVPTYELRTLLELRYLSFLKWAEIAAGLGREERSTFELHGKALECVKKIIQTPRSKTH